MKCAINMYQTHDDKAFYYTIVVVTQAFWGSLTIRIRYSVMVDGCNSVMWTIIIIHFVK